MITINGLDIYQTRSLTVLCHISKVCFLSQLDFLTERVNDNQYL